VYLVGGYDGHTPQAAIYSTSDGSSFRTVGQLPTGLRYAGVASTGSNVIIAGGVSAAGTVDTIYSFDPGRGKVSKIGHLPSPVAHASTFFLGGLVYLVGGADASDNAVDSVTSIDPTTGATQQLSPLHRGVSDSGVAWDATQAWILGGLSGRATSRTLHAEL
jgi:N-acetylneuraminic acid mutarotase